VNKKRSPGQRAYDIGYKTADDQDETELDINVVEAERNDLIITAADVDFYDLIINDPSIPAELRVEAEAQRTIQREQIVLPDVNPYLEAEQGLDLPDADDLPDDEEDELVASIEDMEEGED